VIALRAVARAAAELTAQRRAALHPSNSP
jgi:hypothetical protein